MSDVEFSLCLDNVRCILSLGAVVSMNDTFRIVNERDGSMEICAHVQNRASVAFSFKINLLFDSPQDSASVY